MLRELWGKATRNPIFKLLSFVLAILSWWYVQQEQVHETRIRASVDWQLRDGLISPDLLPSQVTLTVRGTGLGLKRAKEARVRLPVDIRASGVGQHEVEFTSFDVQGLPEGLEVLGCSPTAIRFTLDEIDQRNVNVTAVLVGEPDAGHIIEKVTFVPPVVQISGPRSVVSKLMEIPIKPLDVSTLNTLSVLPAVLNLPRGVTIVGPSTALVANIDIAPELERRVISGVPISVWSQNGWASRPTVVEVTLEGASQALAQIQPIDVAAFVHLPDQPENPFYVVPFGPSEGVRVRISVAGQKVHIAKVDPPKIEVWRQ
ncbi:MAG: hypothetical protein GWP91_12400 [Rhodobacterales bacterium]|nr:hypothetical protein [Rhodobacterales bacterium]